MRYIIIQHGETSLNAALYQVIDTNDGSTICSTLNFSLAMQILDRYNDSIDDIVTLTITKTLSPYSMSI